ncbi:hypothetical protein OG894_42805 (plasmid) [Streptomyces sp. NBC_01724]|uniref:hypothetical protein n=1 Tax=Streptomyces sp. NBC_01724 TaxID=2975922 RepID=UPI002E3372EA|nr:hypothetical protein [Streptomyces sp. NBC_01724]
MQMVSPEDRGFTAANAARAAATACRRAGLPFEQARLVRLGENAIYALPAQNAVVRVARSVEMMDKVTTELTVSRWLIEQGYLAAARSMNFPSQYRRTAGSSPSGSTYRRAQQHRV